MLAIRDIGKGNGSSVTVPVSDPNLQTAAGSAVKWDTTRPEAVRRPAQRHPADDHQVAPSAPAMTAVRVHYQTHYTHGSRTSTAGEPRTPSDRHEVGLRRLPAVLGDHLGVLLAAALGVRSRVS